MQIGSTRIEDTFAEAFGVCYVRLIVTAHDEHWLRATVGELTGYSASVIGCDAETGVERWLDVRETPDGRPGASILAFGFSAKALAEAMPNRVGQCVMTCPTTAAFDGLADSPQRVALGKHIRYFGDGFQKSKQIAGKRFWRVPVMDGEFLVEESLGVAEGVAGGNIILQADALVTGLAAARRASEAVLELPGVMTPFPGGVVRSGSKVGSRYKALKASTADAYCPTLRGRVASKLDEAAHCAYEIVIDGTSRDTVAAAMAAAIRAAAAEGVLAITAGNYGGKLGKYPIRLHEIL